MKVKAKVTVDLENRKITDILFYNSIFNSATGLGQIKAFIRRRVLDSPIQQFTPENKRFFTIDMMIDVYPLIKKNVQPGVGNPYRFKLSPLPIVGKESDMSFEEYEYRFRNNKWRGNLNLRFTKKISIN